MADDIDWHCSSCDGCIIQCRRCKAAARFSDGRTMKLVGKWLVAEPIGPKQAATDDLGNFVLGED